jgi:hypothetical protein
MTVTPIALRPWSIVIVCAACGALTGCGGGASASRSQRAGASAGTQPAQGATEAPSDAQSAATGDIPDNQAFLTFADASAGYSIRYPEGWTRRGGSGEVTFQDRANVIRVAVAPGTAPTSAQASAAVARMRRGDPTIASNGVPQRVTIQGSPVIKLTYTRLSKPDPVTGKRLAITIDRYEYARSGRTAIVDLGTPKGVDNVDAYRMISRSFRWR